MSLLALLTSASFLLPPVQNAVPKLPADVEPVTTTASGLKYCVLKVGPPGTSPKFGDKVVVHYTGWHLDGSVFDSSRNHPAPTETSIGAVIEGWNEALQMMTPGAHWKLTIPPNIAYGASGDPPGIAPNETLIFELELFAFEPGPRLRPGDPTKQKKSESGLIYEPIIEGHGEPPKPDDALDLRFAIWNTEGRLIEATEISQRHYCGRAANMPIRLMQIAPQLLTLGARYRFEVPAALCERLRWFGQPYLPPGSTTIWEIELAGIRPITFTKPDPAKQTKTASGLKYEILKEGSGVQPKVTNSVTVVYTGFFEDGTLLDSSLLREWTATFALRGSLMKGWIEGLQLMKEGSCFRFEIPSDLAYGPKGKSPRVPPNTPLIFDIELVKVGS